MKKWLIATALGVFAVPLIVFGRDAVLRVFANSDKVPTLEQAVLEQHQANAEMKGMLEKQDHRADLQDAEIEKTKEVTAAQLDLLKELVIKVKQ